MTHFVWDSAFDLLMINEGGYVNNKHDKGGKTNYGVTQATFNVWNKIKGRPLRDVRDIMLDEAKELYHEMYWLKFRCEMLPDALSIALFDFCVTSKPPRPTKFLQECLGVVADGIIGNQTICSAWSKPLKPIIDEYHKKRISYYMTLPDWKYFGNGWGKRVMRTKSMCEKYL